MPTAINRDQRVSLLGTPTVASIRANRPVVVEHWIDDRPSRLHSVLAGKKRPIPRHGRPQQSLVRCFLSGLLVRQVEFSLITYSFPARFTRAASAMADLGERRKRR
jgi:hypothetical protein